MTDLSEYRRLADEYENRVYGMARYDDPRAHVANARAELDAYVERLHATIEDERAVLRGKTILDSDHAREALAALEALEALPHLHAEVERLAAENARLREAVERALAVETSVTQGQERELRAGYVEMLRAAVDAARQEAGNG
jgi:hypothetical protein